MKRLCTPQVLVVTAPPDDHTFFSCLGETCRWKLTVTGSVGEALELVASLNFPLIVCDRELPGQQWRNVIARMKERAPRSCVLLISPVSDDYLWREVLRHGGYDVIPRPLQTETVSHLLDQAWYYWNAAPPDIPA
ncbi:MAG: response regulator receiver protein [Bryobacterales bacterium]|jgi:DNA-binding NtrC family response regulator|nr:response regulator receiver protein [Bryobacterales bacterium]